MREPHEPGLELGRRRVDAVVEQRAGEGAVGGRVAHRGRRVVDHRPLGEEGGQHRADAVDRDRRPAREDRVLEGLAPLLQAGVGPVAGQLREDRDAGGGGERVPRQRPRLVAGALRGELGHHVGAAAERAHREPPADHLAEAGEVGPHLVALLRPAAGDPEAGDDLVEDQEGAPAVAGGPQRGQVALVRRHHAHVPGDRLHQHRRRPLERRVGGRRVVVGDDAGRGGRGGGHARAGGHAEGGEAAAGLGEEAVDRAVVAAGDLHDRLAPGGSARQPHRPHHRLAPRGGHAQPLDRRERVDHGLGEAHLALGGGAVGGAEGQGIGQRAQHRGRRVAQDRRAPARQEVNVAGAVGVPHVGTLGARDEERIAADRPHRAHGRVDPTHQDLPSAVEELDAATYREDSQRGSGFPASARSSHSR